MQIYNEGYNFYAIKLLYELNNIKNNNNNNIDYLFNENFINDVLDGTEDLKNNYHD